MWPFFPTRTLLWLLWSVTDRIGSASLFFFCVKCCAFTMQCLEEQRIRTVVKIGNNKTVEIRGVTLSVPRALQPHMACICQHTPGQLPCSGKQ